MPQPPDQSVDDRVRHRTAAGLDAIVFRTQTWHILNLVLRTSKTWHLTCQAETFMPWSVYPLLRTAPCSTILCTLLLDLDGATAQH